MSVQVASKVFVTGLQVQAQIGVYRHEIGRVQPLIVDVELDVPTNASDRLAEACLQDARVTRARVRIEKPLALAPHAVGAGVEIVLQRG